jgi:hypothetical protein
MSIRTKLRAALRQSHCPDCARPLDDMDEVQADHCPPLQLRVWDEDAGDTVPAANDPLYIVMRHTDCHRRKTTGRKGESELSVGGGDQSEIAKTRRLEKARAALLQPREKALKPDSPKRKIPSRPFPKKPRART